MHLIQGYLKSCPTIILKASSIGGTGVHIFFFCSGFGLYLSYIRKPINYFGFMKKRFLKIYIPYIIVIAVSALIPFMYDGNHIRAFFSHVFMYKMFIPKYESSFGTQFWYISTLFQLYFVFVPLCRLKDKLGNKRFLILTMALSVCWWGFIAFADMSDERILSSFFLQYLWEFALGMVVAEKLKLGENIECNRFQLVIIAVFGIAVAAVAALKGGILTTFNDIFAASGYLALALFVYSLNNKMIIHIILFVSTISYELYLVHILVFKIVFTVTGVSGKMECIIGVIAFGLAVLLAHVYKQISVHLINTKI
jgi:peptidoglycan/LPS O-acetylase OafA/YrhL